MIGQMGTKWAGGARHWKLPKAVRMGLPSVNANCLGDGEHASGGDRQGLAAVGRKMAEKW